MENITKEGFDYKFDPNGCELCGGGCCSGESGYIWVKYAEIKEIAEFINLTPQDFATMYLRKVKHRYSLIEKEVEPNNFACIFFDESIKRCSIYSVRPTQCRTFPFWEQFKNSKEEVQKECPAII